MGSEDLLKEKLQDLQRQIGKKQSFEEGVSSIKSLLIQNYSSASPSLRKLIYSVVCRVATVLQTRYTSPGFWFAGKGLFEEAERLVTEPSEREHLKACVRRAREHLHENENQPESEQLRTNRSSRYLFEGHLTVDPEPPQPLWLVAQNMASRLEALGGESNNPLETASRLLEAEASGGETNNLLEITSQLDWESVIEASLQDIGAAGGPQGPPPASKEVVMKLPKITVTEEILARQSKISCTVCQEELVINDEMQELPCKHLFHPLCLKPWLDKHNSCPICRYELPTDDYAYENRKELEKEAEEERRGAANALPGGEFMYV